MRPMQVEEFKTYWKLVESDAQDALMIDCEKAELTEWEVSDPDFTLKCAGMQHKNLKIDHGIARAVSSEGSIHERTLKEGKFHGLHRAVFKDKVRLSLYQEGVRIAYMAIDHKFAEIYRSDPYNYLETFKACDLKL